MGLDMIHVRRMMGKLFALWLILMRGKRSRPFYLLPFPGAKFDFHNVFKVHDLRIDG